MNTLVVGSFGEEITNESEERLRIQVLLFIIIIIIIIIVFVRLVGLVVSMSDY